MGTELWAHQREAVAFCQPRQASIVAAAMGTGKTCIATTLADNWEVRRTLVICPSACRGVWRGQLPKHSSRDVDVCVLDKGSVKQRTQRADEAWQTNGKPLVVVINYEGAWRPAFAEWCLSRHWDLVIADESQRIMGTSRTAQFAAALRNVSDRRLCLSGTPMTQDPISVWAQCRFLDPRIFGEDLDAFKERYENKWSLGYRKALKKIAELGLRLADEKAHYAVDAENEEMRSQFAAVIARIRSLCTRPWERPDRLICGTINTEEYLKRLGSIAFRCENAVLDLPPLTVERRVFDLSRQARRIYDAIAAGYLSQTQSDVLPDIPNGFAVTMRCQQITSGFLPLKTGKIATVDTGKAELCKELLDEAGGEPVVVFCRFTEDLNTVHRLADELGLRYGEVSGQSKNGITDRAEMAPWVQVCGVQEAAGGAGIDLSAARIGIDYSPSWSLDKTEQKLARLHRPPQSRPVIIYRLEAENTVDGEIRRALDARRKMVSGVWNKLEGGPVSPMAEV